LVVMVAVACTYVLHSQGSDNNKGEAYKLMGLTSKPAVREFYRNWPAHHPDEGALLESVQTRRFDQILSLCQVSPCLRCFF
jgi:hypothetical protein